MLSGLKTCNKSIWPSSCMPHHRPKKWRESFRLSNSRVPLSPHVWTSHAHVGGQWLRLRRDFECTTCGRVCLWQTKETVRKIVCLRFMEVATTTIELRITHLTETCPARHGRFCRNRRRRDHITDDCDRKWETEDHTDDVSVSTRPIIVVSIYTLPWSG